MDKNEKIKYLLSEFAIENGTIIRSTSDISPLEMWLLNRLASHEIFFDGVSVVIDLPTTYYNSTQTINQPRQRILFKDSCLDYIISIKGQTDFLKP